MADSSDRPALQLFQQVFKDEKHAELEAYLKEGGSIFPLVEKGVQALVREYGVNDEDARQFLRRANSLATYVRRQFIEHRLTGNQQHAAGPSSGLLSMVAGPSYERLFGTPFDELCPPDALESCTSPVAYLIELLRWIRDRIEPYGVAEEKYLLHERRKDLKLLSVDFNAVHQAVSSVDIIVAVLEKFITEHGPKQDLEEALIQARYPNGLPYYQHWVSIDAVARHHGLSVGNFAHMVDLSSPYFLRPRAWDADAGRALAHASRLGPYQRKLLMEAPALFVDREVFCSQNFGTDDLYKYQNLNQVRFFGEQTKLDTPGIEALLSVRGFAPVRSANVTYAGNAPVNPESERSGSVYLNANAAPAVSITSSGTGPSSLHRLSADPDDEADFDRYDRMNRKIRLDAWLELPSDQVDALLVAAIKADVRGGAAAGEWWISDNVVHALGLFQSLRERYGCTAQDFAAFIDEMSVYGRGETLSQFDQVFNNRGDYRQPLKLDDQSFPVLPAEGATDLTVNQLCSGLGIDPQTYHYLALAIAQAHGLGETLKRSPAIISSFYRLVKLPRLLGITPVEGVLMLSLLGGEDWLKGLAGTPRINTTPGGTPDVLNLIYALHSCVGWCRDLDLPVLWMLQQISEPQPLSAASEPELQLFEQVRNLLPAALFTNVGLLMAGVPPLAAADWLDLLSALVDADGLVLPPPGSESGYVAFAREQLDRAVKNGLGDIDATLRAAIVEQMLGVLLLAREAQVSVVKECLAVYAGVDAEQAIRVLNWANATAHLLLRQVLEGTGLTADESVRRRNEQPDPLLMLLADVKRRSAVVAKLGLSAVLLQDYLDYGHKAWLDQDDKHAFTVRTLYYLSTLTRAFELSEQPAQKLLDYLRQVNALPDVLGDALWLAQQAASIKLAEFFGWSVQEVRECVSRIDSSSLKILKNLTQLDLLMRIRVLSAHSGMDALTIFLIGHLPEAVDKKAYADAAEHALLSLSEARAPVVQLPSDLKQLVQMTCTEDKTEVVANKPGEKITFTVTLKDAAGKPLSGVNVYWNATLGSIATKATWTDGTVEADFIPGKVMGTDTPTFWLDLFEEEYAPTVHVLFETTSLTFPRPLMSPIPLGVVAQGDEVELYATLMDKYSNPGKNSLVRWFAEPDEAGKRAPVVIRPEQAFTNQQGLTRVFISSPAGGTFTLSVLSEGSETVALFEPITFEGEVTPV
jgi:hypothetical protein